jgi:UPF0755 protein
MLRKAKRRVAKVVVLGVIVGFGFVFSALIAPMPSGPKKRFVMVKPRKLSEQLAIMSEKGVIRSAFATNLYGMVLGFRGNRLIAPGVYEVHPGQSAGEVLKSLVTPLRQLVRLREGRWAARTAKALAEKEVCSSEEYTALVGKPEMFKTPGVPIVGETLEGYLYPDTYNFPPELGAELVIRRQLMNFAKKTKGLGLTEQNVHRTLIIASMLELESAKLDEKKLIAGVIENRLKKGMRLQIDATVNYGMQLWRPLFYKDYTAVKSPYNTYLTKGLPPGPICSPTIDSIKAALSPAQHNDLFYISLPDGRTLFTPTYEAHLKNVQLRDKIKAAVKN